MKLAQLAEGLAAKLETVASAEERLQVIRTWLRTQKDEVLAMYEEEDVPLVRNHDAPGDLALGDYVFASRWGDCDPGDPWAVGHISELGSDFVVVGDVNQRRWPKAMRISHEQGRRILEQYPAMETNWQPRNYEAIAEVFGVSSNS